MKPIYMISSVSEPIAALVRRIAPNDLVLTDAEAEAIMERARAAAVGYEDKSHRAYQMSLSVFRQKRALKELAELQDEAWRGCVASFISDSD
jgi:hypothetical protein